ncbi:MAG: hypothetical protein HRT93_03300 [Piscirickettsiaceae bacterium]|nr:hypothetical protein [Piscirickettsiaceae bacterium]
MTKHFLCVEDGERFYIESENMETAKEDVIVWNAEVICEVPKAAVKLNPNTAPLKELMEAK